MNKLQFNKTPIFMHKYLTCTKEVILTLISAEQLAKHFKSNFIEPHHIFLSLFLEETLSQTLLNKWKPTLISTSLKKILNQSKKFYKKIEGKLFSVASLKLLISLIEFNRPFHTLDLLIKLIEDYKELLQEYFNISQIDLSNILELFETQFSIDKLSSTELISPYASNFLTKIDSQYSIVGRQTELTQLLEIISRHTQRNPIILGQFGIGRRSLIKFFTAKLKRKELPIHFINKEIWLLDSNALSLISNYTKEDLEKKLETLLNYIKIKKNIILIIPDIHLLFTAIGTSDQGYSSVFLNILKPLLELNHLQIIGTSTPLEYEKTINKIATNLFDKLVLSELSESEIKQILKTKVLELEQYHKVSICSEVIWEIYKLGKNCLKDRAFPEKAITLLDIACAKVKIKYNQNLSNINVPKVTLEYIFKAISELLGIPETFLTRTSQLSTSSFILNLESELHKKVFGQEIAISKIASAIRRAYSGLKHPNKPIGSWLLCGPSGTGKTELAKSIAHLLFGSEKEMVRFDMSEFMEKHSVSRLIGSPPGYVGYGEGGQLTDAVHNKPYTVLLFDEIEKAHGDVNNLMLQLLDDGHLTDSTGKLIDFSNTIVLFTSNLGCPTEPTEFKSFSEGSDFSKDEYFYLCNKVNIAVKNYFRPEFINRLDNIIVFQPLSLNHLNSIVEKFLNQIRFKLKNNNSPIIIDISSEVKCILANLAYQPLYGARPLKRLMDTLIEKPISEILMNCNLKKPHIFYIFFNQKTNSLAYALKKLP